MSYSYIVFRTADDGIATVTFFRKKTGQVQLPGKNYCGDVRVADIGIPNKVLADIAPQTFVNEPDFWLRYYPRLNKEGHKYDRGHAIVVGSVVLACETDDGGFSRPRSSE